ncbi:hypothetical protein EBR21_17570 [bacterium]|nr:hypothetical protein [bacterium]
MKNSHQHFSVSLTPMTCGGFAQSQNNQSLRQPNYSACTGQIQVGELPIIQEVGEGFAGRSKYLNESRPKG